jgi:hypothetical protein
MYKLSEDISKSAFFYEFPKKSVFLTYHVIEAKKRVVSLGYSCKAVTLPYLLLFFS